MTELEQAQADAQHARSELLKARMLLARWSGVHDADVATGCYRPLPSVDKLKLETDEFQRETSQFPKQEA